MKGYFLFFMPLLWCHFLPGQDSKWLNYAADYRIRDILSTDECVWIGTQGGLVQIDRKTGQKKIFQPWNSGLRGNDVAEVDLSPDGNLWVSSSRGGLFRFDGVKNWEQFYNVGTVNPLSDINQVEVTPQGKLWILANREYTCANCAKLYHYDGHSFSSHDVEVGSVLGIDEPRHLAIDTSGALWVSSSYKIARYIGNNATDAVIPLISKEFIRNMAFDRNNTLWVSTLEYVSTLGSYIYRIRYLDGNGWSELDESILGGTVYEVIEMFQSPNGDFFMSFNLPNSAVSTFAKFDGSTWEYTHTATMPDWPSVPNAYLHSLDNQGHFWFVGYDDESATFVYEFDGQNWKSYDTEVYPLVGNQVYDVAFDCNRNTWFGGRDILTKFDGISWKNYTLDDMGINADFFSVWSLAMDTTSCNLWISFYDAYDELVSFAKFDGNTFTKYPVPDDGEVFETAIDKDGMVWVASQSAGLGKFNGQFWTWYNNQNSPISDFLQSVTIDHEQNVWVTAESPYSILRWDGTTWLIFDENNAPVSKYADWLFVDYAGMIWTSSQDGLLRFNGVVWDSFPVPGTESQGVYAMAQDQEHNFWVSNYSGLQKWDGNGFESYNLIDYPIGNGFINRIRVDAYGNKWLSHPTFGGATVFNEKGISNQIIDPIAGIHGAVYFDSNQDGQKGPSTAEPGIPNEKVFLMPVNTTIFTNHNGNYSYYPQLGNYQLSYSGGDNYTPTSAQYLPFTMGTNDLNGLNFGAWAENSMDSIALDMTVGNMRCNQEAIIWLSLTSYGNQVASGDVTLLYDPKLTFLKADPAPDSIEGNLLLWHYSGLSIYELLPVSVVFQVPEGDTIAQILSLQSGATVLEGGIVTASAECDERAVVLCSFDPNDKSSTSTGPTLGQYSLLSDALEFTVRFQNTGNDTAFTIVIRDTLDANLDFSTLKIVASSHPVRTSMSSDGVLTFVFDRINLLWEAVDYGGSQGFVKYRIASKTGLPDTTVIRNTANIYFDLNPAITTNTTTSVLVESLPSVATDELYKKTKKVAKLYPNPCTGDFWVDWPGDESAESWQINILDMLGRNCFKTTCYQKSLLIRGFSKGLFFVFLEKEGRVECHKLLIIND